MNDHLKGLHLSDEVLKAIGKMKKELTIERAHAPEADILRGILKLSDKDSQDAKKFREIMRFHFSRDHQAKPAPKKLVGERD